MRRVVDPNIAQRARRVEFDHVIIPRFGDFSAYRIIGLIQGVIGLRLKLCLKRGQSRIKCKFGCITIKAQIERLAEEAQRGCSAKIVQVELCASR